MSHWLDRMLSPDSIAIVGASERQGSLGAITYCQLRDSGFSGNVYSINPKYPALFGQPCYASLTDLPRVPDLVIFAISGIPLEQSFDQAIELGVGGMLIYAANYLEDDSEPRLPQRLRQKATAARIPVCGGNSMGFYNYDAGVFASFDYPPTGRPAGHISLILHSGSGMTYLANNDSRFCFNYVIASSQETNASVGDYMDYLLEQTSTRVIAIFLETVRDVPVFIGALEKARRLSIPVVITPLGRTEKSAQLAKSHSGAIVGNHDAFVALCRRYGAILCRDLDEMIITAMLFGAGCRVDGGRLASMLDSGGMREQMMDLADDYRIPFAEISDTTTAILRSHLESGLEAVNPMDGMGDLGRNTRQTYLECGKALLDDPATGLLGFEFEFRDGFSHYPELLDVARELAVYSDKPVILINSSSYTNLHQTAVEYTQQGIPIVYGIDVALRAIRNLMAYQPEAIVVANELPEFDRDSANQWKQRLASIENPDELTALEFFSDFDLPTVDFELIEDQAQITEAAQSFGFPLVLKTAVEGIAHKSDQGGVRVGIRNSDQLETEYRDLCQRLGSRAVVMPQVTAGVEVSLGMKNDPQYGPLVIVGCGGVLIELLAERAFRLAPIDCRLTSYTRQ